jgi:Lrp/AsnC family leucine-responsive transcriptional regulator
MIRLQIPEGGCARFVRFAPEFPEIQTCDRVTGGDSYIMRVVLASIQHLESLLDRLATHGTTITSIVLSSPVTHRILEPPGLVEAAATAGAAGAVRVPRADQAAVNSG